MLTFYNMLIGRWEYWVVLQTDWCLSELSNMKHFRHERSVECRLQWLRNWCISAEHGWENGIIFSVPMYVNLIGCCRLQPVVNLATARIEMEMPCRQHEFWLKKFNIHNISYSYHIFIDENPIPNDVIQFCYLPCSGAMSAAGVAAFVCVCNLEVFLYYILHKKNE